jgi:hypothetical protein
MEPLRQWLEETHSDSFELVRHFLARFFDNEMGTNSAEWRKVAIGIFACVVSIGILGFQLFYQRFNRLQDAPHPHPRSIRPGCGRT